MMMLLYLWTEEMEERNFIEIEFLLVMSNLFQEKEERRMTGNVSWALSHVGSSCNITVGYNGEE